MFSMSTISISTVKSTNALWVISLQVEDHDTPPEELHYLVISKPNNGYLTLGERPEPVTSFTQYDVNHRRLHFIQQVNRRPQRCKELLYCHFFERCHHCPLLKQQLLLYNNPFCCIRVNPQTASSTSTSLMVTTGLSTDSSAWRW